MPDIPEPSSAEQPLFAARNVGPALPAKPTICIGLAAGGLNALELFVGAMASPSTIAVIVCYRAESQTSHQLARTLRQKTSMPIHDAEDGIMLKENAVYLLPDIARMVLVGNHLVDFVDDDDDLAVPSLDLLLHSLAVSAGPRAMALLLGSDHDGVRGSVSVKRAGGLVLVEDPKTADAPNRARAVIESGLASAHAAPDAMPSLIGQFLKAGDIDFDVEQKSAQDSLALGSIMNLLRERTGLDLEAYRKAWVLRRIHRRASLGNINALDDYIALLTEDAHEVEQLHDDLAAGVMSFFRDPDAFGALASKVVPSLVEPSPSDQPIRIWVPGCSTGEEAYSLAMLIADHLARSDMERVVEIVATDRSHRSLETAEIGLYSRDQLLCLPADFRSRYMEPIGGQFRVCEPIRDLITFAEHDILDDAPLVGMDLVSCRDLLINMTDKAQATAFSNCRHALAEAGFLFLGPSETPRSLTEGLSVVDRRWQIYRKILSKQRGPTLEHLPGAYRELPAETIQPPEDIVPHSNRLYPLQDADDDHPSVFDGLMEQNQQLLESTIDTLLASNDALRRRNRDLRTENQRLAAANAALDDMATMVAHDLKAPLSAVEDLTRRLRADVESRTASDDQRHYLNQIQHRISKLRWLVDDLLAYAREDPDQETDAEQIQLGDLIGEVLELIGLPPGFKIEVRPSSMVVKTRRTPLACILRNLLANAIEQHGGTKGHIRVVMNRKDDALELQIIDDGRGQYHDREPLGIAITRQLLSAEGGDLNMAPRRDHSGRETRLVWPIESF